MAPLDFSGLNGVQIAGSPDVTQMASGLLAQRPDYSPGVVSYDIAAAMDKIRGGLGVPDLQKPPGMGLANGLGLGIQGLSVLGSLVMGLKQLSLANKQFAFQKQFATTNLTNQVKSYNTALADRLNARQVMQTGSTAGAQAQIDANKLSTTY